MKALSLSVKPSHDSVVIQIARAYWSVIRTFEAKSQSSHSRLLILSLFRKGASFNQNQIATILDLDRTVAHRILKTMVKDDVLTERRSEVGRQILLTLTPHGEQVREGLIRERTSLDKRIARQLNPGELENLIKMLEQIAALNDSDICAKKRKVLDKKEAYLSTDWALHE
jgi:DNA-binding MarR family transcriptional regulator